MWKWASEKLKEMGLLELSEKAKEIDNIMVSLYGTGDTEKFKEDLLSINYTYEKKKKEGLSSRLYFVESILDDEEYTIACEKNPIDYYVTDEYCKCCEFAKKHGTCEEGNMMTEVTDAMAEIRRCIDKHSN